MDIDELITDIRSGRCDEMFACGTAAIVNPISALADNNKVYELRQENVMAAQLKSALLDIQEQRSVDTHNWMLSTVS